MAWPAIWKHASILRSQYHLNVQYHTCVLDINDLAESQIASASAMHIGYAGDVWNPQPPPEDHPWRTMPNHGMTPHYSGTTIDAQVHYTVFSSIASTYISLQVCILACWCC